MFRVLWRFPLYGSGIASVFTPPVYGESWAFPVNAVLQRAPTPRVIDQSGPVEVGHKRTP